jgi:hypothetical protein
MKKLLYLAPVLLLLTVFGCKKNVLDALLTFTVDVSQNSKIPPPNIFYTGLPKPISVITNSEASFRNNKTSRDKVKNVLLDQMQLTLVNPASLNFDFLDSLKVYINTPNVKNRILLAHLYNPPTGVKTLTLVPTTDRLDDYLKADTYELTVYSRQRPNYFVRDSLTIRSDTRFKVTANSL